MTAIILDRPRNEPFVLAVRKAGARIALIGDGDIQGSIATAKEDSGIDILFGIGGSPEAVTSACAMAALDGGFNRSNLIPQVWCTSGCYTGKNRAFTHNGPCAFVVKGDILSESE